MKCRSIVFCALWSFASALEGLYYQLYTDAYVARYMQPQMSCVTAIFDDRGFYVFNGYDFSQMKISNYKGQLKNNYKNKNCFEMKPNGQSNRTDQICLFAVDSQANFVVATNGDFKRTFILTRFQPDHESPSWYDPDFVIVNETISNYGLSNELVRTNHTSCFFYPPKNLDYIIKQPSY